jgi:hypothetical protein
METSPWSEDDEVKIPDTSRVGDGRRRRDRGGSVGIAARTVRPRQGRTVLSRARTERRRRSPAKLNRATRSD